MFFCPKCKYVFDVRNGFIVEDKQPIKTVDELFEIIKDNDEKSFNNYIPNFEFKLLKNNSKFKKLSKNIQKSIEKMFVNVTTTSIFSCNNCGFKDNITKTIKLYEINFKTSEKNVTDKDDIKLLVRDPTLPRTKDYNCKNINCITHKQPHKKEAVYTRLNDTFSINYICTTCYTMWDI